MTGYVTYEASKSRVDDLHRRADRRRAAATAEPKTGVHRAESISVRRATHGDSEVLEMLAALDGAPVPSGDVLIAEVGDEPQAAVEIATGVTVADPFRKTAHVVELLSRRAAHLRPETDFSGRLRLRLRSRSAYRTA
jgi:hypothetical protein